MKKPADIDVGIVREFLSYDPITGALKWKTRARKWFPSDRGCNAWNAHYANKPAFTALDNHGYRKGLIFRKTYQAHRIAFTIFHGRQPAEYIDHINGDKADNRIINLREVTLSENSKNQKRSSTNTSGFQGVHWNTNMRKWQVYIRSQNVRHHLGFFVSLDAAVEARKFAERKFGFHENHGRD